MARQSHALPDPPADLLLMVPDRALPALVISTCVQIVNMPIIRATISLQNPGYGIIHTPLSS